MTMGRNADGVDMSDGDDRSAGRSNECRTDAHAGGKSGWKGEEEQRLVLRPYSNLHEPDEMGARVALAPFQNPPWA